MIDIKNKVDCCGCYSCYSICAHNAIAMVADKEGFVYPKVDANKCIDCGMCENVCPISHPREQTSLKDSFILQYKSDSIRKQSSSGGAFTAIAEWIIKQGGVVFGAEFNKAFEVEHNYTETVEGLSRFRGSKYVQSNIGDSYSQAKQFLKSGKTVLFTGVPCQISGLLNYLRKPYDNLYTIEVICHGVPSPLVWREYLKYQENKHRSKITNVSFRDKSLGYASTMKIQFENGQVYRRGHESDIMLRLFFSEITSRPSCYDCKFKGIERQSDFSIYDCWSIRQFNKEWDDDKGTSNVIINTEKAQLLYQKIDTIRSLEVNQDKAMKLDGNMIYDNPQKNPRRDAFMSALKNNPRQAIIQYSGITRKDNLKGFLKPILVRFGILHLKKKFFNKKRVC